MIKIQPRTYNEALRLSRCLEAKKYSSDITDEIVEEMYHFISAHPQNKVSIANGTLCFTEAGGEPREAYTVNTVDGFEHLVLSAMVFAVVNATSNDSGCGCGCSSNNNNNNNNNNS